MAKAHFYQLQFLTEESTRTGLVELRQNKKIDLKAETKRHLKNHESVKLTSDEKWVILDTLGYYNLQGEEQETIDTSDFLFGGLGNKAASNAGKRDQKSLKRSKIDKTDSEHVEIGTYFCLFFDRGIVIYITAMGAPKINTLQYLYNTLIGTQVKIFPIISNDTIALLTSKDKVTALQVETTLPIDEVLNKELFLSKSEYDGIRDDVLANITLSVSVGNRKQDLLKDRNIQGLLRSLNGLVKKVIFKAKDDDETSQMFTIDEDKLVRNVDVVVDYDQRQVVLSKILEVYLDNKSTIEKYTRI